MHGEERAQALAYVAFKASHMDNSVDMRFGCGNLRWDGFHGDAKGQFKVHSFDRFLELLDQDEIDWDCDTFVSNTEYCWNSVPVATRDGSEVFKCLGHPTAAPDCHSRDIRYADDSVGYARKHSASVLLHLKCLVNTAKALGGGLVGRLGLVNGNYHHVPFNSDVRKVLDLALSVYWAQSDRKPIVGLEVFKERKTLELPSDKRRVIVWDSATLIPPELRPCDNPDDLEYHFHFSDGVNLVELGGTHQPGHNAPVSYTHLTLPTKRIV